MFWSTLRYLLTASCRDTTRVASDECDGPVSWSDWWAARLHRLACRPCRRTCRQMRLVDQMIKSAPAEQRERIASCHEEPRLTDAAAARISEALQAARDAERESPTR